MTILILITALNFCVLYADILLITMVCSAKALTLNTLLIQAEMCINTTFVLIRQYHSIMQGRIIIMEYHFALMKIPLCLLK